MTLPFDAEQALTLLTMLVVIVIAYAELKFTLRDYKRRTEELEKSVNILETKAEAAALLKQAVDTLSRDVRTFGDDLKTHSGETKTLSEAVVRLTTTMDLEARR